MTIIKNIFGGIILLAIVIMVLSSCFFNPSDKKSSTKESKPYSVMEGENGFLIQPTFLAVDEESYEEYIDYSIAGNTEAIQRLLVEGKLFPGKKGDRVTVVDFGFMTTYIELVDDGVRGFVETEYVKDKIE